MARAFHGRRPQPPPPLSYWEASSSLESRSAEPPQRPKSGVLAPAANSSPQQAADANFELQAAIVVVVAARRRPPPFLFRRRRRRRQPAQKPMSREDCESFWTRTQMKGSLGVFQRQEPSNTGVVDEVHSFQAEETDARVVGMKGSPLRRGDAGGPTVSILVAVVVVMSSSS